MMVKRKFDMILAIAILYFHASAAEMALPEEMFLSPTELIQHWGYPAETHEALTDDGYYLTMHRIPHGRSNKSNLMDGDEHGAKAKPIMLLLPGLLLDSTIFVSNLPRQSLGFVLADNGYDVWMGNNRGTTLSKKHKFLLSNSTRYWDFSFDEMAEFDLPSMIDYILKCTGQSQVYYVGYSQSTTLAFAAFSSNTELQKKVKKFFALAPITRSASMPPLLMRIFVKLFTELLKKSNTKELFPRNQFMEFAAEIACPLHPEFCRDWIVFQCGGKAENFNASRVPLYLMHIPAGTSAKNMEHYAQEVYTNEFKKFDYGLLGNLIWYGSLRPPMYNLRNIFVPTVLFSGSEDPAANPVDVKWTASQLQNVKRVIIEGYGHVDFSLGMDAREKVYDKIMEMAD